MVMKKETIYFGQHTCKDVQQDDIIVCGVKFSLAPDAMEVLEYMGLNAMKTYLRNWGYKYIRVKSNNFSYIFTNELK